MEKHTLIVYPRAAADTIFGYAMAQYKVVGCPWFLVIQNWVGQGCTSVTGYVLTCN